MVSESQKVTEAVRCDVCDRLEKAFCQVCKNLEEKQDKRASSVLKGQSPGLAPLHLPSQRRPWKGSPKQMPRQGLHTTHPPVKVEWVASPRGEQWWPEFLEQGGWGQMPPSPSMWLVEARGCCFGGEPAESGSASESSEESNLLSLISWVVPL